MLAHQYIVLIKYTTFIYYNLLQFITILTNITVSNFHQKYLIINKKIKIKCMILLLSFMCHKKKKKKMSDLVVFYVIIKQIQNLILFIILLCVNLVNNINIGK
jgi:hypothetical protein